MPSCPGSSRTRSGRSGSWIPCSSSTAARTAWPRRPATTCCSWARASSCPDVERWLRQAKTGLTANPDAYHVRAAHSRDDRAQREGPHGAIEAETAEPEGRGALVPRGASTVAKQRGHPELAVGPDG